MTQEARATAARDDPALLDALRHGDEAAFEELIGRYHQALTRSAMLYVPGDRAGGRSGDVGGAPPWPRSLRRAFLAEDVAIHGRGEPRAVSGAARAAMHPVLGDGGHGGGDRRACGEPQRFETERGRWLGQWTSLLREWQDTPESSLLSGETRAVLRAAIETLPATQRAVVTLRDVEGLTASEVCNLLELRDQSEGAASPRPVQDPARFGAVFRSRCGTMRSPAMACSDLVELVTEYVEGTLSPRSGGGSRRTSPSVRAAVRT